MVKYSLGWAGNIVRTDAFPYEFIPDINGIDRRNEVPEGLRLLLLPLLKVTFS